MERSWLVPDAVLFVKRAGTSRASQEYMRVEVRDPAYRGRYIVAVCRLAKEFGRYQAI
jgi:hypothetical protein